MRAAAVAGQVDGSAAVGTVDRLHVLTKGLELLRRQRPDEILLAKKIKEGRQPPVVIRATQVFEAGRPLHIVRPAQPRMAARALCQVGVAAPRRSDPFTDDAEKRQRGRRRQTGALASVEPDRLTGRA